MRNSSRAHHEHSTFKHSCIHAPRNPKSRSRNPSPQFERRRYKPTTVTPATTPDHRWTRCGAGGDDDQDHHDHDDENDDEAIKVRASALDDEFGGHLQRHNHHYHRKRDNSGVDHELGSMCIAATAKARSNHDDDDNDDDDLDELMLKDSGHRICDDIARATCRYRSMTDFYESIPDYTDINHLSEAEFYLKLERLKIQQQELMDEVLEMRRQESVVADDLHNAITARTRKPVSQEGDDRVDGESLNPTAPGPSEQFFEGHSVCSDRSAVRRPPSKTKTVRISSGTTCRSDDFGPDDYGTLRESKPKTGRCKSASPMRFNKTTVPKPFSMTKREEEDRLLDDMSNSRNYLSTISLACNGDTPKPIKARPFKANPVPVTSRIPLFDHIQEEQKRKSDLAKLNSAIELQAQMKPFQFTESRRSCLSRTASSPNLSNEPQPFKASPPPKNMFSNYFYHKMWEDEYFRSINRKIRAEEMLKISSLPPSMARRNEQSLEELTSKAYRGRRKKRKSKKSEKTQDKSSKSIKASYQLSNSSVVTSSCRTTPIPSSYPVNRPNLAATLRVATSRKKVKELSQSKSLVPATRLTLSDHPKDSWQVKKSPAWKSVIYDGTNMEDIAMRLATRRAEQRLRTEEHKMSMDLMRKRVRAAPLLLEGQTYWSSRTDKLTPHRCASTEAFDRQQGRGRRRRPSSRSVYSMDSRCQSALDKDMYK